MIGRHPLLVVVGSGGVGKTTLAAALGLAAAEAGSNALVITFDPSLRLKDALKVGDAARGQEVRVPVTGSGTLHASLLDPRQTFDRLVERYAPDDEARRRILENRFYHHLSGSLAGILEYMAVERLFEIAQQGRYDQVILDTPPTRQALDFLEAPQRIVSFLDSPALGIAQRKWFDDRGRLKVTSGFGFLGRKVDGFLDRIIGVDFLRDVSEFFQAFGPLFSGFRQRAQEVQRLLQSPSTRFLLVAGPGQERIPDALFFARKLEEASHRLDAVVVNRVHPLFPGTPPPQRGEAPDGRQLIAWLGERDHQGLQELQSLLPDRPVVEVPMLGQEPTDLAALTRLGVDLGARLSPSRKG
jgi:anion-transporting  ArsA/GET3 family ATPase